FEPVYLPPYSPDFNPIENIWLLLKQRWFNNVHCRNVEKLIARLDEAILDLTNNPGQVMNTTSFGILF
ncbi:transposase, partial [Candidatus Magnetominusculus xianensis]|uniref:transposase n=1 Tax=Candidatus Magnetominusculus xianensis TaxID=1748249 RepID=UPI001F1B4CA1